MLVSSRRAWKKKAHTESCRAVRFAENGRCVLSASKDCSILASDVSTGRPISRLSAAHDAAINRLEAIDEHTFASGDDLGTVKIWDTREQACSSTYSVHEDFISDMEYAAPSQHLLACSGDGTLSVEKQSENGEDELLSLTILKKGKKVVCGTQGGPLLLYSWGQFDDCSDRFPGHPESVDSILKVDEDTIVTGSSDGLIRIVSILPNKMLGIVGEHADYPIERLAFSHDRKTLASASHDKTLKLWNVAYLTEDANSDDDNNDDADDAEEEEEEANEDRAGNGGHDKTNEGTPREGGDALGAGAGASGAPPIGSDGDNNGHKNDQSGISQSRSAGTAGPPTDEAGPSGTAGDGGEDSTPATAAPGPGGAPGARSTAGGSRARESDDDEADSDDEAAGSKASRRKKKGKGSATKGVPGFFADL
eukprot:jgi/Mesen1/1913/ME000143S00957